MKNEKNKVQKNKKLQTLIKLCKKFNKDVPNVKYDTNLDGTWIVKILIGKNMYGFGRNKSKDKALTDACIQA